MIFAAESSSPTSTAAASEFTRYVRPSPSNPNGGTIGHDSLIEQKAQGFDVHAFDPACELVVRSAKNSGRMGDDRVDVGRPQVHGGQTFHDLVGQANCRIDADPQRDLIGDARPVRVRQLDAALSGELDNLKARSMHENDLDAQRAQDRQVEQNVGKIVRSGNFPVEGNNEHALPETGNVLEDFTQVGNVHFDDGNCRDSNSSGTLKTKVTVELSSNDRGQHGRRLQRRKNPAIRHRHDPGAFEFLQDLFSSRTRKARGTVWP